MKGTYLITNIFIVCLQLLKYHWNKLEDDDLCGKIKIMAHFLQKYPPSVHLRQIITTLVRCDIRILTNWKKGGVTAEKMKFSIKDFYSKCDQIRCKLQIWCSVSSAKTFGHWLEMFGIIQIRNKRVSKTEPSGTPIFMLTNFEHWPLKYHYVVVYR